jgi:hypothetical protein
MPPEMKPLIIVTQCIGLPSLYSHPTLPLSVHYALNLFCHAQKSAPFILCPQRTRRPVLIAFSRTLILLLLLYSSGDVEVNSGPVSPSSTPIPQALSFVDFHNRTSLGFIHVNIRSLLPEVFFPLLAPSANSDVLAVSESRLRKTTKKLKFPYLTITFSNKLELPKGAELQSTAEIACRVLSYYPGLCPNNLSFYF